MRVLVTGASGHVGGATAAHLLERGHEVIGLSRGLSRAGRNLSRAVAVDLGRAGVPGMLVAELPRCDAIVHAAAALESDPYAPAISLTNGLGTQQMLELAALWGVASFVFLSSVPVIGAPLELPVTELHSTDPPTAYHASKLYGEQLLAVARRAATPALSLRLTAPVGPGMPDGKILSVFVRRAIAGAALEIAGQGSRGQDYVDVRDIAAAVEASLERRATGLLNVASGLCVSNLELAERCVEALGSASTIRLTGGADPQEGVRWEISIAEAQRRIGYEPRHTLEDSIRAVAKQLGSEGRA